MSWLSRLFGRSPGTPPEPAPPPAAAPPTAAEIVESVRGVEAQIAGRVPAAVTARVHGIARTVEEMAPRLDRFGVGSRQAHTVVATATSYLPEAVGGYLRLPREWADTRPIDGYKTSLMVLVDQLELLGSTMDKILDAANRSDAQALIAHGRFLQAKFGQTAGPDLTIGPA